MPRRPAPAPSRGAAPSTRSSGATPVGAASGSTGPSPRRGLLRRRGGGASSSKQGRLSQLRAVYRMTRTHDPAVTWWVLGAFVLVLGLALAIGFATGHPIYATILGLPLALLAALFFLARRAERAAYGQLAGQPGAAGAALRVLRRGWHVEDEPVAIDPRTRDAVFRVVGRPGVVLVSDGPAHRVGKLLEAERRRVARVLPDVPVHLVQAGDGEGQVPLSALPRRVMRLKGGLTKQEVAEVVRRLRALGGLRPPIPRGIDPTRVRPDRKGARGR
ncbi:DUF4191 domain-containing protein [Quadrisphaera sp. DSM 44207]|uniref:DUF4191 domain-containing protein n=1 Tax=Quadrisphaera sp. DSM 44207 TaxID=1881057 RepID=UPI000890184E|nr:DUF4191 domain-containing protein [Quadrisphaera sp. DSM 44207]SDQ03909.1 protein of unknown function [Quadrisphaera sp. DSM 44207]